MPPSIRQQSVWTLHRMRVSGVRFRGCMFACATGDRHMWMLRRSYMRSLQKCLNVNPWPRASSTVPDCMNLCSRAFMRACLQPQTCLCFHSLRRASRSTTTLGKRLVKGPSQLSRRALPRCTAREKHIHTDRLSNTRPHTSPHCITLKKLTHPPPPTV